MNSCHSLYLRLNKHVNVLQFDAAGYVKNLMRVTRG